MTRLLEPDSTRVQLFEKAMACAALTPALRAILVFDASPTTLHACAERFAAMLAAVVDSPVKIVCLGSTESEGELWGTLDLRESRDGLSAFWKPGVLVPPPEETAFRIVLIPDLARLSLSAARACIAMVGAEAVTLQQHGQDRTWAPRLCWLAGLSRDEVGAVSPHLLDRFVLRLQAPALLGRDRAQDISDWITEKEQTMPMLGSEWVERLHIARNKYAPTTWRDDLLRQILARSGKDHRDGLRRYIALARLTRSLCALGDDNEIREDRFEEAAQILGLEFTAIPAISVDSRQTVAPELAQRPNERPLGTAGKERGSLAADAPTAQELLLPTGNEVVFGQQEAIFDRETAQVDPYPEDTAPVSRPADSLRLPLQLCQRRRAAGGPVIGIEHARGLHDVAFVSTILQAAMHQKFRSIRDASRDGSTNDNGRLKILREDLRSYRRAPVPQYMFVLLLDYTCLGHCKWEEAILPHLSWAYIVRASINIVQVGAKEAQNPLCAEQITSRGILSPRVNAALEATGGTATPLAHGFDIAIRTLRDALQHGRGRVEQARFVVITDGRGNVPLEVSRAGRIMSPVSREGIDDALRAAQDARRLHNLQSFLLNPQPNYHPDLPHLFGEALHATLQPVPPSQAQSS